MCKSHSVVVNPLRIISVTQRQQQRNHRTAGFTLIEVLVALVVLTIGILGVAVLFTEGLRFNRTSMLRTTAVALAADMAERIRANQEATGYAGTGPGADADCGIAGNCTPDQIAAEDWFLWRQEINSHLPTGSSAKIDRRLAGPDDRMHRFDIVLSWPEVGSQEPVSYTLSVQL
jgi:type IV pilus assembly protein PilV